MGRARGSQGDLGLLGRLIIVKSKKPASLAGFFYYTLDLTANKNVGKSDIYPVA